MSLELIMPPAVEPITLAEAKDQIGLSPLEDTDPQAERMIATRIRRYITSARSDIETRLARAIITQSPRAPRRLTRQSMRCCQRADRRC